MDWFNVFLGGLGVVGFLVMVDELYTIRKELQNIRRELNDSNEK